MTPSKIKEYIQKGLLDERLTYIYGKNSVELQRDRYLKAIDSFISLYGEQENSNLYSVSGRSELSGNHTDHNCGCVIAASVSLDIIAVAAASSDSRILLKSEGFDADEVDIQKYTSPDKSKFGSSASIIAGMCAEMNARGYHTGGFCAYTTSNVPGGSGLSSSAAFEDMIGNIENHMYNNGSIDNVEIAKMAQIAENKFFGKPCGLMDQVACAAGGAVAIDFKNPTSPIIEKIEFDLDSIGYNLCIINTGGNHADLTDDYASIPSEMKAIASYFGKNVLREINKEDVISGISALREKLGDRAILRALHFFDENRRVQIQKNSLLKKDYQTFFENVNLSGKSSFCYLQNVYTSKNTSEQGISLALNLAERFLDNKGAYRVHGGGFAGTIQAYVPTDMTFDFAKYMDACFGKGACMILRIRPVGAIKVL